MNLLKKSSILVLSAIFFILLGCASNIQNSIPFIMYCEGDNGNIEAMLSYWDVNNNDVTISQKSLYSINPDKQDDNVLPIIWDGRGKMMLKEGTTPDKIILPQSEIIGKHSFDSIITGKNIKVTKQKDANGNVNSYNLKMYQDQGDTSIEKDIALSYKYIDTNGQKLLIGDDEPLTATKFENNEATFIFCAQLSSEFIMFVAKYNVSDENIKWDTINIPTDIVGLGQLFPFPINSALIENKYYIQSEHSFAQVDLISKETKKLDLLVSSLNNIVKNSAPLEFPHEISIWGEYNDVLILYVPINTSKNSFLAVAIKDNVILSSLYFTDNKFTVIGNNNSEKNVNLGNNKIFTRIPKIAFPNINSLI